MTVEEVIRELEKFPAHFEVQAARVDPEEDGHATAELSGTLNHINEKIVYLTLDGPLIHE